MSRKLEKLISDNRNEFDDAIPSEKVWENLAENFSSKKSSKKWVFIQLYKWSIAAAILLTAGTVVYLYLNKEKTDAGFVNVSNGSSNIDTNTVTPEYADELNGFAKLVSLKQDELKALAPEQPELYRQFTTDISQLDSSYKSLKNQLGATPNREMLIEAMIQNLQLQLNVLNQQLKIINQIKQSKKYSDEKDTKTI